MRFAWLVLVSACSFTHGAVASDGGGSAVDTAGGGTCADGVMNGDEVGVDCGGGCLACDRVFAADDATLALFELNGDASDASGHDRDATLIGGSFVATAWGQGLDVPGIANQGFQWSAYANLLVHPYTIEMVVTPADTGCWKKLFGPSDSTDLGWHYCSTFQTYPDNLVGPNLPANQRHYLAIVSMSAAMIAVHYNGAMIGTTSTSFTAPPGAAIFFRDDSSTGRTETLDGVIEAVRLSGKARSATEISAVQGRLESRP
jgi:hypothetical protein